MRIEAETLLRGPRGRRLLLEIASECERAAGDAEGDESFCSARFFAAHSLDPNPGTIYLASPEADGAEGTGGVVRFEAAGRYEPPVVTAEEAAERLAAVTPAEPAPELLRRCLTASVDAARYWQEPDGDDVLAATAPMREALAPWAERVAASPHAAWWGAPVAERGQWTVVWNDGPAPRIAEDPRAVLRADRERLLAEEVAALRERPDDPAAPWSGEWWSRPPWEAAASTRELFDGGPAGLWFVEDGTGEEEAGAYRLGVPAGLRVLEIDSAEAWAGLCARFPLEVTASKRHDWYRTTGRSGAWVIPDWAAVAEHFDAVHLQLGAYLAAAGTAIPVDAGTATVIAGWDPDTTYWFTPRIRHIGDPVRWSLDDRGDGELHWARRA